jgi:hypothetical protein
MKFYTLFGGLTGFVLSFPTSLSAGADAGAALLDATVGCLIGAALFRGFRWVMLHQVKQLALEKARARQTATSGAVAA